MEELDLRGIFKIVDACPEKNKYREGRHIVFYWDLVEGRIGSWVYVHNEANHKGKCYVGKFVQTSPITSIKQHPLNRNSIQLTTANSQYTFERLTNY